MWKGTIYMLYKIEEGFIESSVDKLNTRSAPYFSFSLRISFLILRKRTGATEILHGFAIQKIQKLWKIAQVLIVNYAAMRSSSFIRNMLIVVIMTWIHSTTFQHK